MRVDCLSGMVLEMRPWSLDDMGEMAIRATQSSVDDQLIIDAVSRQHVATIDPGPYTFVEAGDAHFDWRKVLKADVLWALYRVRAASFPDDPERGLTGEDYIYEFRCTDTDCDGHRMPSPQRLRLCDLKTRKLPEPSFAVMRSGASFETKVAGRVVKFVLPTFALDAPLLAHLKREKKRTKNTKRPVTPAENIAAQITYIEGVKGSEADLAARARWLGGLTAHEWVPLRDAITNAAPIIGNKTDATCETCGRVTPIPIPLSATFFAPPDRSEALLEQEEAKKETQRKTGAEETLAESPDTSS